MKYAVTFGVIAAACFLGAGWVPWWSARLLFAWVGIAMGSASVAYGGAGAGLLGKRPDGELPLWSLALNGPFLVLGLVSLRGVLVRMGERVFDEVEPGVLLGRRPTRWDGTVYRAAAITAVLDLCAELPRSRVMRGDEAYLSLPVLDAEAPDPAQLARAAAFIEAERQHGTVLVHCALGHARSATVVAAWLRSRGSTSSVLELQAYLRRVRPAVAFTAHQRAALERQSLPLPPG